MRRMASVLAGLATCLWSLLTVGWGTSALSAAPNFLRTT